MNSDDDRAGSSLSSARFHSSAQPPSATRRLIVRMFRTLAGVCLLALLAVPSAARAQSVGAGVSFLGDERGPGLLVDFATPRAGQAGISWVGEVGFNHKGFGGQLAGVSGGITTVMAQGGLRASGEAGDSLSWLAHGMVGIMRSSFGAQATGINKATCDQFNIDCSAGASDIGGVLTVGGGIQYDLSSSTGLRGQVDIPIAIGANGGATSRFAILLVFKR